MSMCSPLPAGRTIFCIEVWQEGEAAHCLIGPFDSSCEAAAEAMEVAGPECKVVIRPLIETTRLHGRVRYPHPLHVRATEAARLGWAAARDEADHAAAGRRTQLEAAQ